MTLAIFDLDNTLLGGDSDYEWGQYLVNQGHVDRDTYEAANKRFYEEYKQGVLDIREFARFSFKPLTEHPIETLHQWREDYIATRIRSIMLPASRYLIEQHKQQGHTLMIITATNRFITEPIARELGIEHLLATDPEMMAGKYTGELAGIPCFQSGKVERLKLWMAEHDEDLSDSWFYSDSHNDIPLLELVSNAVAVDADEVLDAHAQQQGWTRMSLREGERPVTR